MVQSRKQFVEGIRQDAQFLVGRADIEPAVQILVGDVAGLLRHPAQRRQALGGQKESTQARDQHHQRQRQIEHAPHYLEVGLNRVERFDREQDKRPAVKHEPVRHHPCSVPPEARERSQNLRSGRRSPGGNGEQIRALEGHVDASSLLPSKTATSTPRIVISDMASGRRRGIALEVRPVRRGRAQLPW